MSSLREPSDPLVDWPHDQLGSGRFGPFRMSRVWTVPTYLEDNILGHRHWGPPGGRSVL